MTKRKQYIILTCDHCGKRFDVPPWRAKRRPTGKKYCSIKCKHLGHRNRVEKQCRYCGKAFEVVVSLTNAIYYCSKDCRLADGWIQSDPSKHSVFICDWCGKEFEEWTYRQPRFCSAQCRSEYAAHQPKGKDKSKYITLTCDWCGKKYKLLKSYYENRGSRFCCAECRDNENAQRMTSKGNPNWKGGVPSSPDYGTNWERQKRKAKKRDNHTCQICSYVSGGDTILDVHHIKPIREFNGDWKLANSLSNLITLCRECHVKVEYNKIPCPIPQKV